LVSTGSRWRLVGQWKHGLEGVEIEIRPQPASIHSHPNSHNGGDHSHLTHVEVLPRPTPGGLIHCAVFPSLSQGRYELSERPFRAVRLEVSITGGQITQATWPTPVLPTTA
jgi:hypothetical protein